MIVTVARAFPGSSVRAVALQDWAWTLWSLRELQDVERLDGLVKEHDRLELAFLTHFAMLAPENLNAELQDFRERAGLTLDRGAALTQAEATVAGMKRLNGGG